MSNDEALDVSIILACYNEADLLEPNIERIKAVMDETRYRYELILYDDCSPDHTRQVGERLAQKHPEVVWRRHERNMGRGATVTDGLRLARGKIAGFIDVDLEIPPVFLLPAIAEVRKGADVAIGLRLEHPGYRNFSPVRFIRRGLYWLLRYILSMGYNVLARGFLGIHYFDTEVGLKFFDRGKILPLLDQAKNKGWFWDTEIVTRAHYAGLRIVECPVLYIKNTQSRSTVKIFKDVPDYFVRLVDFWRKEIPAISKRPDGPR